MYKTFALEVEQVVNKYASKYGLSGLTFECSVIDCDGADFMIKDGIKVYQYRCYGIAAEHKDNVWVYFQMSDSDYSDMFARDIAFICIGIAAETVSRRVQGVSDYVQR